MENILRQLVADDTKSDKFKSQLIRAVLANMATAEVNAAEAHGLLKLYLEWILNSENPGLRQHGHEQFKALCGRNPEFFTDFVTPHLLIEVFKASSHSNRVDLVVFSGEVLDLLHDFGHSHEITQESFRNLTNIAKVNLYNYLKEQGIHLDVCSAISSLYQSHPHVLPPKPEWTKFCIHIITFMAGFRHADPPGNFFSQTENISKVFPLIWGQSESRDGIQECLKAFYSIISSEDSYSAPSCALASVIDKIPQYLLEGATHDLLEDSNLPHGEARTVLALQNMIGWLTMRPTSPMVSKWILQMLRGLQEARRNSILIEIGHSSTSKLASALTLPQIQKSVEDVFFFLLLGFQHSESVFHSLAPKIPKMLEALKSLDPELAKRLGESVRFLMLRFPDFPELYNPIAASLESLEIGEPTRARFLELQSLAWLSPIHTGYSSLMDKRKSKNAVVVDESLLARSETGLVGLLNLGNTCYMNSILQAIYFTTDFCDDILSAPISADQKVLFRLQQVIAYLRFTQRAIYSPNEFLKAARPPWFEDGRQQDCSEFLRYLLDTLHEQEKQSLSSRRKTVSGEDKAGLQHPGTKMLDKQEESLGSSVSISISPAASPAASTSSMASVASNAKSSSTMALDVIEEDPEHVVPGSGNQDEEMMSQGSEGRTDEDFFGSRGSLGMSTRDCSDEDNEAVNDFRGSKTSLGSGMKRWLTEENLSSNEGSREGKMDILDGHLHGSHSNSTDSGIQSVGSRESMDRGALGLFGHQAGPPTHHPQNVGQKSSSQNNEMEATGSSSSASTPKASTSDEENTGKQSGMGLQLSSLVEKTFGGKMRTRYECSNCRNVSEHLEVFTELHLAVPDGNEVKVNDEGKRSSERQANQKLEREKSSGKTLLTVQSLLQGYFEPEILENDNQYHCDRCQSLQDAEKSMEVLSGPKYLLCTLMRFKYDRALGRKHKIFTDVAYECEVKLPLTAAANDDAAETYSLYAIVIHSGYSTDGGHYYTYARPPPAKRRRLNDGGEKNTAREKDENEEQTWFVCNDSKVSFSTFESFKNLTSRFPRDSAYQLWYKRTDRPEAEAKPASKRPLRADLKTAVERDNISFFREKERSSSGGRKAAPYASVMPPRRPPDTDRDGNGEGGGGGGGLDSPSLVF